MLMPLGGAQLGPNPDPGIQFRSPMWAAWTGTQVLEPSPAAFQSAHSQTAGP